MNVKANMMGMNAEKKIKGMDYLGLGLYAFGGLGMEILYAYLLEPMLYGGPMQGWSPVQMIMHWILTCITWGIFAAVLIRTSGTKYNFPLTEKGAEMTFARVIICLVFIAVALGSVYLVVNRDLKKAYVVMFLMFVL